MKKKFITLSTTLLLSISSLYAGNILDTKVPTKHNKNLTLQEIAEIQPALGAVMMEFGHRFYVSYYAAKAGNWDLANYEIEELIEAQEVAEATRPKYKKQLKEFETNSLKKLQASIKNQNWNSFKASYKETTKACNSCHIENGHPYIVYELPKEAPKFLKMSLKDI